MKKRTSKEAGETACFFVVINNYTAEVIVIFRIMICISTNLIKEKAWNYPPEFCHTKSKRISI